MEKTSKDFEPKDFVEVPTNKAKGIRNFVKYRVEEKSLICAGRPQYVPIPITHDIRHIRNCSTFINGGWRKTKAF
ncbi:G-type lectin S-receptor-like protein serine/threonine-protein kinase CES101 [Gossypium australe]|uniref:G-type lectin S-receptor-like protein serine/threonine-protein kinase CES101 n=1 Tax=Gossypium australe TaxID=47621 RepID=A0A5B6WWB6_9ROSI|nr:G-type lectin S-receptor-like protein serine/threonine-protein kinase CES101 [Gossypium australe]